MLVEYTLVSHDAAHFLNSLLTHIHILTEYKPHSEAKLMNVCMSWHCI